MPDRTNPKNSWKRLPRWLRWIVIVFAAVLLLNIVITISVLWYVHSHKQELLKKISDNVSSRLDGNFHINDMHTALLRGFPNIAVELNGITLSDSLYTKYHINLLEAQDAYIKLNVFSLLSHPQIIKLTLANGTFHIFNEPNGYSNDYLLKGRQHKDSVSKKKNKEIDFENFGLENFTFNIENKPKDKQLLFTINNMNGFIRSSDTAMDIHAASSIHVAHLGFDLTRGGYLTNKNLQANFHLIFNKARKELVMSRQPVKINGTNMTIGAVFDFGSDPKTYSLDINAPSIGFREAASIVPHNLQQKLLPFDLTKNFALKVTVINGHLNGPDDPIVHATWRAKDNDFTVPFGVLRHATFTGSFYNNINPGLPHKDPNSQLALDTLTASFYGIPVKMWDVRLLNLSHPALDFRIGSDFPVNLLNNIFNNTFAFTSGQASIDMAYHGGINATDTLGHNLSGKIHISDAAFTYVPANFDFKRGNVDLIFDKNNLILNNTTLSTQKSDITLNGTAANFMNLYFTDPAKIAFDWDIHSNRMVFDEFTGLLNSGSVNTKTSARTNTNNNRSLQNINNKLQYVMKNSTAHLHLHVVDMLYRTFSAQSLEASADLAPGKIDLNKASVKFAGGSINANLEVSPLNTPIAFHMQTNVNGVEVDKLFTGFGNFGQSSLTSKNLDGTFSSKVNVTGALTSTGDLIKNSLSGKVSFQLIDGHLINYKPLLSVQKYIFKKRDLGNVSFKTISNNFTIDHGMITIPPMTIASNVIEMNLQGIYGIDHGTDIGIEVPLRDPQKAEERRAAGKKVRKGIVVHLRAKDEGNGKVKLVWDPFHKGPQKSDDEDDNGD